MTYPRASTAKLKSIRSLRKKSNRVEAGQILVEGIKLLKEVRDAEWDIVTVIMTSARATSREIREVIAPLEDLVIEFLQCSEKDMDYISATEQSQGILAVVTRKSRSLDDVLDPGNRFILALDGVQDPGNVGTCIRSAAWFGFGGVLLGEGCASVFNEKTIRASAGSAFHIPCVEGLDLGSTLAALAGKGFHILGADAAATQAYSELGQVGRSVLVLGSEATGFSAQVREKIQTSISVPREGRGESLNVSIAGSIIMSHLAHDHGTGEL